MLQYKQGVEMPMNKYLMKKYGMYENAKVPVDFVADELLISKQEVVDLMRRVLMRNKSVLRFDEFVEVVEVGLVS